MTDVHGPTPAASASRRPLRLSPAARKTTLVAHLIASMGWLTLMICVLVLALSALATSDADTLRTAYRAMPMLGDALILPLSLLSPASGLVLALGTPWRLFRYHWVAVKFWLTLAATVASNLALTARLHEAAHAATRHPTGSIERMDLGFLPYNLVIISCVAIALYTTTVVLSVAKPWGPRAKYRRAR
ncbi:membrane protein [Actinoallomurus liliacearum]|uniref:Membrane protein n=1 Tax=Actinoallomurus liliacearum TaxID=1080073 RepID=A0ABP8TM77_9ACTN